jgi:hypothetical protein
VDQCSATNQKGDPCRAPAGANGLCFAHDPGRRAAFRSCVSKGGRSSKRGWPDLPKNPAEITDPAVWPRWVRARLCDLVAEVKSLAMEPREAAVLVQIYNAVLRSCEAAEAAEQLQEFRRRIAALEAERRPR